MIVKANWPEPASQRSAPPVFENTSDPARSVEPSPKGSEATTKSQVPGADSGGRASKKATEPEMISGAGAVYTADARKARISGEAIVQAEIDEFGNVLNPQIVKGLPLGLNEKILNAVRAWKYKPATRNERGINFKAASAAEGEFFASAELKTNCALARDKA